MRFFWTAVLFAVCCAAAQEPAPPAADSAGRAPQTEALFLLPTAFTPPAGSGSFRLLEVIVPTVGYSFTNSTAVRAGMLLPIFPNKIFFAGFKQRLWVDQEENAAIAITGNVLKPVGDSVGSGDWNLGGHLIASRSFTVNELAHGFSIHGMLGTQWVSSRDEVGEPGTSEYHRELHRVTYLSWGIGTELRLSPGISIVGEVVKQTPLTPDENGFGLVNSGLRFSGEHASLDLGVSHSILDAEYSDDSFIAPILIYGYRF